jgi:hypothetical protein
MTCSADGTGSESCLVVGVHVNNVKPPEHTTRNLIDPLQHSGDMYHLFY